VGVKISEVSEAFKKSRETKEPREPRPVTFLSAFFFVYVRYVVR